MFSTKSCVLGHNNSVHAQHTCQLSRISRKSWGKDTNLPVINKFRRGEGRGVGTWSKIVPIRISHFPRGTNIFSSMDEVIITEVTTLLSILFGEDVFKV